MIVAMAGALLANSPLADATTPSSKTPEESRALRLGPAQMFQLAELAQRKGDRATVHAIYAALASNPDPEVRAEALFRHAKQMLEQNRNRDAALMLRRLVDEKPDAVGARLELTRALQLLGDTNGALRELRAAQSSGLPPAVARLIDRYSAALRAQRSYGANFEIALAPDTNINRATRSDTIGTVFGDFEIADDGKAKSGTGLSLNAQAFRRFAVNSNTNLLLRTSGLAELYRRRDFNTLAFDVAAGPELSLGRDRLQMELGGTQRWFGQKPYMRSARLAGTYSHPLGPSTVLRITGSAAIVDNRINDLQDGRSYSARIQIEKALTPTTGLVGSLSVHREALNEPGYANTGWRTGLTGWHDVGRMTFTAGAEIGRLHSDARLLLFPERRKDRYSRLSFGASFRQFQYAGFAPALRFSVERNRSSIAFYDYRRTRTEIALARAF